MNVLPSQNSFGSHLAAAPRRPNLESESPLDAASKSAGESEPLREAFQDFVGQTMFGSMLKAMRQTTGKPAYMHGGRAEEVFQNQMDQYIVEDLTESSASTISDPMFELFNLQRQS
ncbi:rod-binding protein [Crateriforma conspicua]|uniref:Flagellar protein FlgJ N-terminal domain-containing protein n=1 Tax=Crateriforma conspicua TaxID=2527996 RepID=A0A5C5Y958_9PLAN|nr:rod-binding protein [Crateriforma conspicua]QDV64504.1 hypothetical protein Mal65_36640 [Crateriforma conspicua]TWT69902.1 hypothetical protein Pan14r_21990 [Crateriforma conspicua]